MPVETGEFQAQMLVSLENDGPVTFVLESRRAMTPPGRLTLVAVLTQAALAATALAGAQPDGRARAMGRRPSVCWQPARAWPWAASWPR